jgi:hypothetical protein
MSEHKTEYLTREQIAEFLEPHKQYPHTALRDASTAGAARNNLSALTAVLSCPRMKLVRTKWKT